MGPANPKGRQHGTDRDQLGKTFPWVSARFSKVSDFGIEVEQVVVGEDLARVLWFERFNGSIAGRPVEPVLVRVTHIYRREDGQWKVVHRHAGNPGADPRPKEDR
jgi:ketosteroid isomerase-like protein